MADSTSTVGIVFETDTSNLQSGVDSAIDAFDKLFKATDISRQFKAQPITQMFQALQSSSDKAIAGLIRGTESWGQAMSSVATSMEIKFVQLASHRLINWVESELGMTAATTEGNAARAASDEAASATSIGAQAEKAVSSILSDARQVFGGIFAFLAPEMGPAAAIPAAAGSASVAALASGITYAESGAWNIPSDTLAYLHAGEMVVPQSFASSMRDGGGIGGGGDVYTININAIDTQTGAQFLKNNASVIASTMSAQARNFNRNLPVWKS